jgi:hypothetical protein
MAPRAPLPAHCAGQSPHGRPARGRGALCGVARVRGAYARPTHAHSGAVRDHFTDVGATYARFSADQAVATSAIEYCAACARDGAKEFYVGYTALYMASSKGHIDAVRALLAAGANVDALTSRGATPLWCRACGHADAVRALLEAGAYVETPCDSKRPLHVASLQGHMVAATLLLDAGADANALDNLNRSPFSCATTIAMRALILARGGV